MAVSRVSAAIPLLMTLGVALAGCSTPATKTPSTEGSTVEASSSTQPSAAPTRSVDLSKLGAIKNAFPPGYPSTTTTSPITRDAQASRSVGDLVSYGRDMSTTPESCRPLLKPVEAKTSTDWTAVTSMTGPQDPFIAVSVYDPVSVPTPIPVTGCDRFSFVVEGGGVPDGRAEQLQAPSFDDAVTFALKTVFFIDNSTVEVPLVEYFYTAILDGRTFVNLWARVPSDFPAEPALPDLLTKAVVALRDS